MTSPRLFSFEKTPPGEIERSLVRQGVVRLLGVDEAGRGALCGPVVAVPWCSPMGPPFLLELPIQNNLMLRPEKRLSPSYRPLQRPGALGLPQLAKSTN